MENETNFKFTELVIYKEVAEATIPANPSAVKTAGLLNLSLKDTQQTEVNTALDTGGEASKKDRGKSNYEGNMECKYIGDMMPILATHVMGDPDTISALTGDLWALSTPYTAFDPFDLTSVSGGVVGHSNGTNMLVCLVAGISDTTEPDLTGKKVGDKIVDNTVTWILVENLTRYDGTTQACMPTCGLEYKGTSQCGGSPVEFIKRFEGCYLNSLELNKTAGGIIHKYSLPILAAKTDDNTQVGFASVKDEAGYAEQTMTDFAFKYDDMKVMFNDVEPVNATMFRMTLTRNTIYEDGVKIDTKVSSTPVMTADGEIKLKFTKEQYQSAFDNEASVVKVFLGNARGETAQLTFNNVEKDRVDPDWTTDRFAELTIPLTADGNDTTRTIDYTITSQVDYQ